MKILLIDGNNIAHMAHGKVMSHEGERTETIFTGMNMVRGYLDQFNPDRVAVVWDGGRDPRRMALYPEYKKRKEKTELEQQEAKILYKQMDQLRDALKNLGLTQFKLPGREADDVINSLVNIAKAQAVVPEMVVVTTDKDYFQLFDLDVDIKIFNPVKKKLWDLINWEKDSGIAYDAYLDYKAIVGDPSDVLPGIKGIGPKGASIVIEYLHGDKNVWSKTDITTVTKFVNNDDTWKLMRTLMEFMDLPRREILEHKEKRELKSVDELYNSALEIMNQYGFQRLLNKFQHFMEPFERLLLKEKDRGKVEEG